jgi:hypothetical protein
MKLIKTASGKTHIKINHQEWIDLGKKTGWFKKLAQTPPVNWAEYEEMWTNRIEAMSKIDPALLNEMKEYAQSIAENHSYGVLGSKKGNLINVESLGKDIAKHFNKAEWIFDEDSDLWSVVGYIVDAWDNANTKKSETPELSEEEDMALDEKKFEEFQQDSQEIGKEMDAIGVGEESSRLAKDNKVTKEAKKKTPKQHGFIEQCIKENKDKDSPGGYCASIVDKVKGTTKWRSESKK